MSSYFDTAIYIVVLIIFLYLILSGIAKKRGHKNIVEMFDGLNMWSKEKVTNKNVIVEKVQGGLKL